MQIFIRLLMVTSLLSSTVKAEDKAPALKGLASCQQAAFNDAQGAQDRLEDSIGKINSTNDFATINSEEEKIADQRESEFEECEKRYPEAVRYLEEAWQNRRTK